MAGRSIVGCEARQESAGGELGGDDGDRREAAVLRGLLLLDAASGGLHGRGDGRDPEDEGRCDGDQPGSQQLQHGLQRRIRTLSPSL